MDRIPVELAEEIVRHTSRADLPALNLLSHTYSTLVRNDRRFVLTAHFECSRKHEEQMATMAEIAQHARRNGVKLNLQFYVGRFNERNDEEEYSAATRDFAQLLEQCLAVVVHLDVIGPEGVIDRVMHALRTPAPAMRSVFLRVDNTGYHSSVPSALTIPTDIFAGSAPNLRSVELSGIHLGDQPIPAFARVNALEMALDSAQASLETSVVSVAAPAMRNFKFSFLAPRTELLWNQPAPTLSQLGVDLSGTDLAVAEFAHWDLKHPSVRLVDLLPPHVLSNARRLVLRYAPDALAMSATTEHWSPRDTLSLEVLSLRRTTQVYSYSDRTFNFGIVLRNNVSKEERVILPELLHHYTDTDIFGPLLGVAHRLSSIRINLDYLPKLLAASGTFAATTTLDVCLTANWDTWPSMDDSLWTSTFPALQLVCVCGASELDEGCRVNSRVLGHLAAALGGGKSVRLVLDCVDVDSQGDANWRDGWMFVFHTSEGLYVVDEFLRTYDPAPSSLMRRRPTVQRPPRVEFA